MTYFSPYRNQIAHNPISRRDLLWRSGGGLGGIALAEMLFRDPVRAESDNSHVVGKQPAKVKRVIQLFMAGGASHLDLYDFKPDLIKHHGKPSDFGEHV